MRGSLIFPAHCKEVYHIRQLLRDHERPNTYIFLAFLGVLGDSVSLGECCRFNPLAGVDGPDMLLQRLQYGQ
jgi:hypothetical protein